MGAPGRNRRGLFSASRCVQKPCPACDSWPRYVGQKGSARFWGHAKPLNLQEHVAVPSAQLWDLLLWTVQQAVPPAALAGESCTRAQRGPGQGSSHQGLPGSEFSGPGPASPTPTNHRQGVGGVGGAVCVVPWSPGNGDSCVFLFCFGGKSDGGSSKKRLERNSLALTYDCRGIPTTE